MIDMIDAQFDAVVPLVFLSFSLQTVVSTYAVGSALASTYSLHFNNMHARFFSIFLSITTITHRANKKTPLQNDY